MASALTLGEAIERIKGDLGIDDELKGARAPRAHAPTPRSWFTRARRREKNTGSKLLPPSCGHKTHFELAHER